MSKKTDNAIMLAKPVVRGDEKITQVILRLFTVTGSTSDSRPLTPGYDFAQFHREDFRGRPVENNRDISNQIVDQVEPQECY